MEIENNISFKICGFCYNKITKTQEYINCKSCPLLVHLSCFNQYEFSLNELSKKIVKTGAKEYVFQI